MGKEQEQQIQQAKEAVRRQPGSPAYAFLAEHYLEQNQLQEALEVCQAGFAATPSFERGAVVYLAVLRGLGEVAAAEAVYQQAMALLPRSARLRMAWALLLADAGRSNDARGLAREALDLDPLDREARAFLARLGGTPTPRLTPEPGKTPPPSDAPRPVSAHRPPAPGGPPAKRPVPVPAAPTPPWKTPTRPAPASLPLSKPPAFGPASKTQPGTGVVGAAPPPVPASPPVPAQRAGTEVGPPIEQNLVDDSPTEEMEMPVAQPRAEVRPWVRPLGQRQTAHSMFDLTPSPVMLTAKDRESLRDGTLKLSDLFATPYPEDISEEELAAELRREPRPLQPRSAAAPSPRPAPAAAGEDAASPRAAAAEPAAPAPSPSPAPHVAERPPTRQRAIEPRRGSSARAACDRSPQRRWALWIALLLLVAGAVPAGVWAYRQLRERRTREDIGAALMLTMSDQLADHGKAKAGLTELHRSRPNDSRVTGALALVEAHLAVRFAGERPSFSEAQQLIRLALSQGDAANAVIAAALIELGAGRPKDALAMLEQMTPGERSWHRDLALANALVALGQHARARQILDAALSSPTPVPALLLEAAVYHRRSGRPDLATQEVELGLRVSPGHVGLMLQAALLHPAGKLDPAALAPLERGAGQTTRYRSALALARAQLAQRAGDLDQAARLGEESLRLDPSCETGVLLARWQLLPGGDVSRSLPLLERYGTEMLAYQPAVALDHVRALLMAGRPHEASARLRTVAASTLSQTDQSRHLVLAIRAAQLTEDAAARDRLCAAQNPVLRTGGPELWACIEAMLASGKPARAQPLLRWVRDSQALLYLGALRALAAGDSGAAMSKLQRVKELAFDPAAPLLALARAHAQRGEAQEAVAVLRRAVLKDAKAARSRIALAVALIAAGHDTEARSILDAVVADRPTQPSLLAEAGEAFLNVGMPARAEALAQLGLKQTPDSTAIHLLAARAARASNDLERAKRELEEVLRLDPREAQALVELGRMEQAEGDRAKARRRFTAAIRQRPKDPELLVLLAEVSAQGGDYRAALATGYKAVRMLVASGQKGRAGEVMVELGRQMLKGDKWARARGEELLFQATKPKNAPAMPFLELGRAYRQRNDVARAAWCFRQATDRDPNLAEAYLELGQVLRTKSQWRKDARAALRQYLRLRPEGKEAARVRGLLEKLR